MDPVLLKAAIMGVVEGVTEFLPISSTGHLIWAGAVLSFQSAKSAAFEIVIQTGAVLAIFWNYRKRFWAVLAGLPSNQQCQTLAVNIAVAFLPAALAGVAMGGYIKRALFKPVPVPWH